MTDAEWKELAKAGDDAAWRKIRDEAVLPETRSRKNAEIMARYSLTEDDVTGMLFEEMVSRGKIDLFRCDGGSFAGWLRRYVRGFILNSRPRFHDHISVDAPVSDGDGRDAPGLELPFEDREVLRKETWHMTHLCLHDLWNVDPERALVLLLKTRFFLSSEEIRDMLGISSCANVDQIFSRAVKFMRDDRAERERNG